MLNVDHLKPSNVRSKKDERYLTYDNVASLLPALIGDKGVSASYNDDGNANGRHHGRYKTCCRKSAKIAVRMGIYCFALIVIFSFCFGLLSIMRFIKLPDEDVDDASVETEHVRTKPVVQAHGASVGKLKTKLKSGTLNKDRNPIDKEPETSSNDAPSTSAKKQTIVKSLNVKGYASKNRDRSNEGVITDKELIQIVEYFSNENDDLIIEYDVKEYFGYDPDVVDFIGVDYVCCCKTDVIDFCGNNNDVFLKEFDYKFSYVILRDPPPPSSSSLSTLTSEEQQQHQRDENDDDDDDRRWKLIVYINDGMLRSNKLDCNFVGTVFTVVKDVNSNKKNKDHKTNVR